MNEIFITNTNDFDHQDRFDGQDFFFPRGERMTVPLIAAEHMFGLGLADKTETLIRLGWANDRAGVKKLANFIFTKGVMVEEPVDAGPTSLAKIPGKTTVQGERPPAP